jgi:hypothetical protein
MKARMMATKAAEPKADNMPMRMPLPVELRPMTFACTLSEFQEMVP